MLIILAIPMELDKLKPGYYYQLITKKGFGNSGESHIVHVEKRPDGLYYRVNHGLYQKANGYSEMFFEDKEILKESAEPLPKDITNAKITYSFKDAEGFSFNFITSNAQQARRVVELFPSLARALSIRKKS